MALTPIEQVRLMIGDNDPNFQILTDDEIQYFLDKYNGNVNKASLAAASAILFTIARYPTKEVTGDIEVSNQWAALYAAALDKFIKDAALSIFIPIPYAGGISKEDMKNNYLDNDNVQHEFYEGMNDGVRVFNTINDTMDDSLPNACDC